MPKSNNDKILLAPHPSLRLALNRHTKGSLLQLTERWLQSLKSEPQDENKNIEELVSSYKEFKKSGSKKKLIDKICDDLVSIRRRNYRFLLLILLRLANIDSFFLVGGIDIFTAGTIGLKVSVRTLR